MLQMGFPQRQVADILCVSQSVVARLWPRFQETGRYIRRPGQGRGRCTTDAQDRCVRTLALQNRQGTATRIQSKFQIATGRRLSDQTICNRLHEDGMKARCPVIGPILTPDHCMRRFKFAHKHRNWRMRECESVLFTDITSRLVIDVCMCSGVGGRGTPSVPLLKLTDSVVGHLWFGVEFVSEASRNCTSWLQGHLQLYVIEMRFLIPL